MGTELFHFRDFFLTKKLALQEKVSCGQSHEIKKSSSSGLLSSYRYTHKMSPHNRENFWYTMTNKVSWHPKSSGFFAFLIISSSFFLPASFLGSNFKSYASHGTRVQISVRKILSSPKLFTYRAEMKKNKENRHFISFWLLSTILCRKLWTKRRRKI